MCDKFWFYISRTNRMKSSQLIDKTLNFINDHSSIAPAAQFAIFYADEISCGAFFYTTY